MSKSTKITKRFRENDVLFQEIGNRWYIFTEQDGELIYSVMPNGMDPRKTKLELYEIIEEHMTNMTNKTLNTREAV